MALPLPIGIATSIAARRVPNEPADSSAPPVQLDRAARGMSSSAPPRAPAPNCAPSTPRLTTMRSKSVTGSEARSTAPPPGPCNGMPHRCQHQREHAHQSRAQRYQPELDLATGTGYALKSEDGVFRGLAPAAAAFLAVDLPPVLMRNTRREVVGEVSLQNREA